MTNTKNTHQLQNYTEWERERFLPFVASMPPTANMAPTVALRGRVRTFWSRGRRWGKRWYFIPSISSLWHSILFLSRGLHSRSAKNYTHTNVWQLLLYQQAGETKAVCVCIYIHTHICTVNTYRNTHIHIDISWVRVTILSLTMEVWGSRESCSFLDGEISSAQASSHYRHI